MTQIQYIVEQFLAALYAGDVRTARRYLADQFSFVGPAAHFTDPDQYLRATEHAARAVRGLDRHKVFIDGQDVCMFYDLRIDHEAVESVAVAEWYRVEDDRIAFIRTILDTAPFISAPAAADGAVDPVCNMAVSKVSASTTRTFGGQTYYFCSVGCAEAFESEPSRFVQGV